MGYKILYEDRHLLLCEKPAGMPSQPDPSGQADLLSALRKTHPTAALIHRLDTPTGGVMVFGLTPGATAALSALVQDHGRFQKEYLAILPAAPVPAEGEMTDFLFHDKRSNKSFVTDGARKGSKAASLSYRTLATSPDGHALVSVHLHTGRTHQIRVQFASRGLPLVGDGKYGSREKCPCFALWAASLTFPHPITAKAVTATSNPPVHSAPWSLFDTVIHHE